ncbi:hypothetical protein RDWZM_000814, partial [Blomia tropicalis]
SIYIELDGKQKTIDAYIDRAFIALKRIGSGDIDIDRTGQDRSALTYNKGNACHK